MTAGQIIGRQLIPDKPGSACAACGWAERVSTGKANGTLNTAGIRVPLADEFKTLAMLCTDAKACCNRYRAGLKPAGYAALLRKGIKP